jgi:indole-3-glycerol phosphate synthase
MSDVLTKICATTRQHVEVLKSTTSHDDLKKLVKSASPPRPFAEALKAAAKAATGLIAEIKRASPSKGRIRDDFDPQALALAYAAGGATCLSVLTDAPYFEGSNAYLVAARAAVPLPVLRKDFMLEPYQITESRAIGADCILLIMAALKTQTALELEAMAMDYGMSVLVEVHNAAELDKALRLKSPLIGINNRDLKTLKVDINTSFELSAHVPGDRLVVAESGIRDHADVAHFKANGVSAFLVGESLMRQPDVRAATKALLEGD